MSERVDLEMKTAFLERTVEKLDTVVLGHGNDLAKLERRLALLEQRVRALQEGGDDVGPHDVPPPHY